MCTYNNSTIVKKYCSFVFEIFVFLQESHKKTIYSISICQQAIPDENEEAFLFATCAVNQVGRILN